METVYVRIIIGSVLRLTWLGRGKAEVSLATTKKEKKEGTREERDDSRRKETTRDKGRVYEEIFPFVFMTGFPSLNNKTVWRATWSGCYTSSHWSSFGLTAIRTNRNTGTRTK